MIGKLINYHYYIIIILLFSGCFNTSRLVKTKPSSPNVFSKSDFDGLYNNTAFSDSIKINLWTLLSECRSFQTIRIQQTDRSKVKLVFDGKETMTVALINGDTIANEFDLKVKRVGNYLSIKRNLKLIPIPILFYQHNETKIVLSNDKNGQLDVKYGTQRFLCLFFWINRHKAIYGLKYNRAGT